MTIFYVTEQDVAVADRLIAVAKEAISQLGHAEAVLAEEATLVAQSDYAKATIGDKTVKEIADAFASMYPISERLILKRIYFISAEAGIKNGDAPALAQQLAFEMEQQGFHNLRIHAVVPSNDDHPVSRMSIDVAEEEGKTGAFSAWFYDEAETRVDVIMSAANYKAALNESYYTFTSAGAQAVMSRDTAVTLRTLQQEQKRVLDVYKSNPREQTKLLNNIQASIRTLKETPGYRSKQIVEILADGRSPRQRRNSTYCKEILTPVQMRLLELEAQRLTWPTSAKSADHATLSVPSSSSASSDSDYSPRGSVIITPGAGGFVPFYPEFQLHDHGSESGATIDKKAISADLDDYIATRKGEWSFHYNFLNLMSVLYYIEDCLFGTDHFNDKSKQIKVSAAEKVLSFLDKGEGELALTSAEERALSEGRLGQYIVKHGGLEAIKAVKPVELAEVREEAAMACSS